MEDKDGTAGVVGTERLAETVEAYRFLGGGYFKEDGLKVVADLPAYLDTDERLRGVAFAKLSGDRTVMALTDRRVVLISLGRSGRTTELPLGSCHVQYKKSAWKGEVVTLSRGNTRAEAREWCPAVEGNRIFIALSEQEMPADVLKALPEGFSTDPPGPPLTGFWRILVYEDRIIDHEMRHLPFNGEVRALADSAGNITAVRGRNLAAKGAGTLLLGPVGLLAAGNAKTTVIDQRELFLLIEGPTWAYTQKFNPDLSAGVRDFAQRINVAAKQYAARFGLLEAAQDSIPLANSLSAELRELASLKDDGLLTEDEFGEQKAKLLERH